MTAYEGPRYTWTSEEIANMSAIFSPEEVPEALELFAPDHWAEFWELMTPEELLEELERLRAKREHWRIAEEFGMSIGEAFEMRARSLREIYQERPPGET